MSETERNIEKQMNTGGGWRGGKRERLSKNQKYFKNYLDL